jgi:toxin FitB
MFILDTNVVSELRKVSLGTAHPKLSEWANSVNSSHLYLSSITILELELGVLRLERKDPRQGLVLRRWLDLKVLPEFEGRVLSFDSVVAQRCATLHVPNPRSERDAVIAATALVHGMTIVTRNISDFQPTGVGLVNPWASS